MTGLLGEPLCVKCRGVLTSSGYCFHCNSYHRLGYQTYTTGHTFFGLNMEPKTKVTTTEKIRELAEARDHGLEFRNDFELEEILHKNAARMAELLERAREYVHFNTIVQDATDIRRVNAKIWLADFEKFQSGEE